MSKPNMKLVLQRLEAREPDSKVNGNMKTFFIIFCIRYVYVCAYLCMDDIFKCRYESNDCAKYMLACMAHKESTMNVKQRYSTLFPELCCAIK